MGLLQLLRSSSSSKNSQSLSNTLPRLHAAGSSRGSPRVVDDFDDFDLMGGAVRENAEEEEEMNVGFDDMQDGGDGQEGEEGQQKCAGGYLVYKAAVLNVL